MGTSWHSYGKIYNLGHRELNDLFDGPVLIEEKIDGSQFSFGVFDGVVKMRSRGREFDYQTVDDLFTVASEKVRDVAHLLTDGWTYRGEYLKKPKHNTLSYNRVPTNNIILFDIAVAEEEYLGPCQKESESKRLGFECVPVLFDGEVAPNAETLEWFKSLIDAESVLGGAKMEGVVIKNYAKVDGSKKTLMGKHVSEGFKEVHQGEWRKANPTGKDFVEQLGDSFATEARWQKAVQHLRESGQLTESPQDIAALMKELSKDFSEECIDDVKTQLWRWAQPQIMRKIQRGFPEWYKQQLIDKQFDGGESC